MMFLNLLLNNKYLFLYLFLFTIPLYYLERNFLRLKKKKKVIEVIEEINEEGKTKEENELDECIYEYQILSNDYNNLRNNMESLIKYSEDIKENNQNLKERKNKYKKGYYNILELYDNLIRDYNELLNLKKNEEDKIEKLLVEIEDHKANIWLLKEKNKKTEKLLKINQEEVQERKYEIIKLRRKIKFN